MDGGKIAARRARKKVMLDMIVEAEIVEEQRLGGMEGVAADETRSGGARRRHMLAEAAQAAAEKAEGRGAGGIEGQHPPQSAAGRRNEGDRRLHQAEPDPVAPTIGLVDGGRAPQGIELRQSIAGERIEQMPQQPPAARLLQSEIVHALRIVGAAIAAMMPRVEAGKGRRAATARPEGRARRIFAPSRAIHRHRSARSGREA
jgi:hypothetical protein